MGRPVGWLLEDESRAKLLDRFPPLYAEIIAHHVTLWGRKYRATPPDPAEIAVVGHADAGDGIEALVVTVDGNVHRPDGSHYHITWSLDPASGKKPKDSNVLIADHDWEEIDPIPVTAVPAYIG
ncbi:hypothetical protein [Sphingomicrobium sediminis]|uniref:Uncharacterized protein n=1 Tax=Sphingomicrobium sediminis TaxID=2950949 RepID=A0A9X2J2S2_9SPHN|nr:hypothetical protein [Sphingomicrobium sediminis]MCM8557320.1 hypothetical protein [Sphingomicrobium sediminis]